MKTWTNPSVEELEVKLTAANPFSDEPEIDWDGEFEWENIFGNPNVTPGSGDTNPGDTTPGEPGTPPVNPGQKS